MDKLRRSDLAWRTAWGFACMGVVCPVIDKIDSISTSVQKWTGTVLVSAGACVVVAWVIVMTLAIVTRAFFGMSWQFIEEYTAYFHLVAACCGFAYATYKGKHIAVRLVTNRFRGRTKYIGECITVSLAIWWVVFLSYKIVGWVQDSIKNHDVSLQTQTPMWVILLILAIGLCSLLLSFLIHLFHAAILAYRRKGEIIGEELTM